MSYILEQSLYNAGKGLDRKGTDKIETQDLKAKGFEIVSLIGAGLRIFTTYAIYAWVVLSGGGKVSVNLTNSFFSCPESHFLSNDLYKTDLSWLIFVLSSIMTSYCAKLSVRINVQLLGFFIPTILSFIISYLGAGRVQGLKAKVNVVQMLTMLEKCFHFCLLF